LLKAVIDTNIWISALIGSGSPRQIKDLLQARLFRPVYAEELFNELVDVLTRPKYASMIQPAEIYKLLHLIEEVAVVVKLGAVPSISRDPKDDVFLACALASHSDFLVTGDDDLLVLGEYHGTKIVTASQFLAVLLRDKG